MSPKNKHAQIITFGTLLLLSLSLALSPVINIPLVSASEDDEKIDMGDLLSFILDGGTDGGGGPDNDPAVVSVADDLITPAVTIVTGSYIADFEGGDPDSFTFTGLWHLSTSRESTSSGHTIPGTAFYGQESNGHYDTGGTNSGFALSPTLDLTGFFDPVTISFNYYLLTEDASGKDVASLEVSQSGGSFTTLADNDGDPTMLVDDNSGWKPITINIDGMGNQTLDFRFGFDTVDAANNMYAGFYIDDVTVIGTIATVTLSPSSTKIPVGGAFTFSTMSNDPGDSSFAWATSNASVASINPSTGLIAGNSAGTVTIQATGSNSGAVGSATIEVVATTVSPPSANIRIGATVGLSATSTDSGETTFDWMSSNDGIASVSPTTNSATTTVTGVSAGMVTITGTGTVNGASDTATVNVSEVTISPPSATVNKDATVMLAATGNPSGVDTAFTWSSDATGIATVDSSGLVTGVGGGTANITAMGTTTGAADTIVVTVIEVSVTPVSASIANGDTQQFNASSNGDATFTWGSSDIGVATVDGTGLATSVGPGTTTITATGNTSGASDTATLNVSVVTISPTSATVNKDATVALTATGNPSSVDTTFTWSSDATGVATVDSSGVVTGVSGGTANITATGTTTGAADTIVVTVIEVSVTPANATIANGATQPLSASSNDAGDTTFTWGTSNSSVATVSGTGLVTGTGAGTATITAIGNSSGASDTATINVSVVTVTPSSAIVVLGQNVSLSASSNSNFDSTFTWFSSDTGTATVNSSGVVTGVAAGSVTITATGDQTGALDTASVLVIEVVVIAPSTLVQQGSTLALSASSNGDTTFTWSTDNPSVATVISTTATTGLVTGISSGTVRITATGDTSGGTDFADLEVVNVVVTPASQSILLGGTFQLTATSTLGSDLFTWSTSAMGVATVSATGLVTAVTPGSATITATGTVSGFSDTSAITVESVAVNPSLSFIRVGGTVALSATSSDPLDTSFAWSSSDPSIASVNSATGVVTGVSTASGSDTVTISAVGSNSGVSGTATVTVVAVSVSPTLSKINKGSTLQLTGTSNDPNDTLFGWSTSNLAVAVADGTGLVTGVGPGTAAITAIGATGASATSLVTVVEITITPSSLTMVTGAMFTFTASSSDPSDTAFLWSTSAPLVVTIDSLGTARAVAQGPATITAIGNGTGFSGTASVQVGGIAITPISAFIGPGETLAFSATSTDPTDLGFTWISSDPSVAIVNLTTGLVTGISSGTTTITATGNSSSLAGTVTVTVGIFPPNPTASAGSTILLTAKSSFAGDSFTWSSSDPTVATVDSTGLVTTISPGTAVITAVGSVSGDVVQTVVTVTTAVGGGGGGGGGGGCFIATAAYGTPLATEINVLRDLRNTYLLNNAAGTLFVDTYYRLSPPIADAVSKSPALRSAVRVVLTPIIVIANWVTAVPGLIALILGLALLAATAYAFRRT